MNIGLYIFKDQSQANQLTEMMSRQFTGVQFVGLLNLKDDLQLASMARGAFDKIIICVNAFSKMTTTAIYEELKALCQYKQVVNPDVNIKIVDQYNKKTGEGFLDEIYRNLFGGFVDCQYLIKEKFSTPLLVDLIRDSDIKDDKAKQSNDNSTVNKSILSGLNNNSSSEPTYVGTTNYQSEPIQNAEPVVSEVPNGVKYEKDVENSVESRKTKKQGKLSSFLNRRKVSKAILHTNNVDNTEYGHENANVSENDNPAEETFDTRESSVQETYSNPPSEFMETEESIPSAISRTPEVLDDARTEEEQLQDRIDEFELNYRNLDTQDISEISGVVNAMHRDAQLTLNNGQEFYGNGRVNEPLNVSTVNSPNGFTGLYNTTEVFKMQGNAPNLDIALSREERIQDQKLKLRELEAHARIMEAQASIENSRLESINRTNLGSPMRPVNNERVNNYVNTNTGKSKLIIVTGLPAVGKTTVSKLLGEILSKFNIVLDVDLDFDNRTLSDSFNNLDDEELTRLGVFRGMRDLNNVQQYVCNVSGNLDVIGTSKVLSEDEQFSLEKNLNLNLIQSILRKVSNSGIYKYVIADVPLETIEQRPELLDIADNVIWVAKGDRYGITKMVEYLDKANYDDIFWNKLNLVLNAGSNQLNAWKRYFNTDSMYSDDIADSLSAIVPYIGEYDESFWKNRTQLELSDFEKNILEAL